MAPDSDADIAAAVRDAGEGIAVATSTLSPDDCYEALLKIHQQVGATIMNHADEHGGVGTVLDRMIGLAVDAALDEDEP